jgi:hypothetical protein
LPTWKGRGLKNRHAINTNVAGKPPVSVDSDLKID